MTTEYHVEQSVLVGSDTGTITEIARGWLTIELDNGKTCKKRAKDVKPAPSIMKGSVIDKETKKSYKQYTQPGGKKSVDNGDPFALAFRALDLDEMYKLAEIATGVPQDYTRLNPGMQRMNLGNKVRGACDKDPDQLRLYLEDAGLREKPSNTKSGRKHG